MSDHEPMDGDQHPQHRGTPTHGPNGDFIRTLQGAERDAEAARLRSRGLSYRAIAAQMTVDVHTAFDAVQRALKAVVAEPAAEVRTLELERLDASLERLDGLYGKVVAVLERLHVTVQHGKVIYLPDPATGEEQPLEDDAPVLAAADRLVKIEAERRMIAERRARLLGLDAEQKVSVSGGVKYEIVGIPAEAL